MKEEYRKIIGIKEWEIDLERKVLYKRRSKIKRKANQK